MINEISKLENIIDFAKQEPEAREDLAEMVSHATWEELNTLERTVFAVMGAVFTERARRHGEENKSG